ncbi:MAG: hypothetical protein ACK544_17840 [Microcystis sp.]
MNKTTKEYIKECGSSIRKYWELHPEEQEWLYPMLQKRLRTAITVLEAISDRPRLAIGLDPTRKSPRSPVLARTR